jgi:sulfopyruvate decarboxylase subunit alpha
MLQGGALRHRVRRRSQLQALTAARGNAIPTGFSRAQGYQFPLLMLVSYRGTPDDPVFYHVPKGRVTVFRGIGLSNACSDRHRPIGTQVEQAATYAEEASCSSALLLSREDLQW